MDVATIARLFEAAKGESGVKALCALCGILIVYMEATQREVNKRLALAGRESKPEPDIYNLTAEEAAPLTGMSPRWLYDHARELPYARRNGRCWRFSREGIARFKGPS